MKKLKNISGLTLIEILLGIVISVIMMGAMLTSYNVVNNSYSQVTDKAKISREKLSFLVDSTAAPVASLALISSWTIFQMKNFFRSTPRYHNNQTHSNRQRSSG